MRSGSAAIARNGKIDVMPITWKSACASDSEKMAASFALPYGRARKRTRRIRSATLWINRDKAVPSYTFKNMAHCISQRRDTRLSAGKTPMSKLTRRWSVLVEAVKGRKRRLWNEAAEARFHKAGRKGCQPVLVGRLPKSSGRNQGTNH